MNSEDKKEDEDIRVSQRAREWFERKPYEVPDVKKYVAKCRSTKRRATGSGRRKNSPAG